LSIASDESRVPSPVTTTLSPSLCLHPARVEKARRTAQKPRARASTMDTSRGP
jgi:hypothetical protein